MKNSVYSIHYDNLRKWLKSVRESKGLSLRDIAALTGRDHSIYGKIEKGRRRIDLIEFVEYCAVLGIDPQEGIEVIKASIHKR